jgi:acetyltransferase-like isoleucine patch superfamily enzyme
LIDELIMKSVDYFSHSTADVQSIHVGHQTNIWQFCVVLAGARIGARCNICAHCFLENDVVVGDDVTIKCGVQLWDGLVLEDKVCIGPNVTFTNDRYPRSKNQEWKGEKTIVKRGASIGANSTILPGLIIGEGAMIGAGSVVTHDVPPGVLVLGNPARVVRAMKSGNAPKTE